MSQQPETTTYDPTLVTVIWDGMVLTGYAQDSEIVAERNEDGVSPATGIQGDTAYSINANRSGTVRVTLFNTSASMGKLRADAQANKEANLTLRNANDDGGFIVSHDKCRILKMPPWSGGKDSKSSEVSFYVPQMVLNPSAA